MRAGSPFNRVRRFRRGDGVLCLQVEFFAGKWRMWRTTPIPDGRRG
jgi:hypothetical protein